MNQPSSLPAGISSTPPSQLRSSLARRHFSTPAAISQLPAASTSAPFFPLACYTPALSSAPMSYISISPFPSFRCSRPPRQLLCYSLPGLGVLPNRTWPNFSTSWLSSLVLPSQVLERFNFLGQGSFSRLEEPLLKLFALL